MSKINPTMIRCLVVSTALLIAMITSSVRAEGKGQVETTTQGDDYGYKFEDDALLASTLANSGDIYAGRKRYQRTMLMRPRTNLCPQMFKSVENL